MNAPISWPADKVDRWPIDRLVPYARNARTHTDAQIAQVAASIREWGWTNPVLVDDDGGIIAGHCRVLAARQLGLDQVPVMMATGWSEAQKRAYVLADNQLALNAGWDVELLKLELSELDGLGFDLGLIGFDDAQLAAANASPGLTDPDEVPPEPVDPVSRLGDLWVMGPHRLLCGDATSIADVQAVLDGKSPDAVVTDPPYGVGVDYAGGFTDTERNAGIVADGFMPIIQAMDCPIALTPGVPVMWDYPQPAWVMVWVHPAPIGGCAWGFSGVNPILVYGKDPYLKAGKGRRPDHIVIAADREGVEGHPTPKPFKVWVWLVERVTTSPGNLVFEPFNGSGTTIIACEQLGRKCSAIELSPQYVDVALERWQQFTGQSATHAVSGETFEQVKASRQKAA